MDFRIRAAVVGDAEAVALLSGELGYPAQPRTAAERLRRILARDDQRVVVAELADGRIGGWLQAHSCAALESGFRVEIVGLVVSAALRRRGVGRALGGTGRGLGGRDRGRVRGRAQQRRAG
jgi:GNAT superfamily N-acetyltransferase